MPFVVRPRAHLAASLLLLAMEFRSGDTGGTRPGAQNLGTKSLVRALLHGSFWGSFFEARALLHPVSSSYL